MQVGRLGASLVLRHLSPSAESHPSTQLCPCPRHTRLHNVRFDERWPRLDAELQLFRRRFTVSPLALTDGCWYCVATVLRFSALGVRLKYQPLFC